MDYALPLWGAGGRRFKSFHPDHHSSDLSHLIFKVHGISTAAISRIHCAHVTPYMKKINVRAGILKYFLYMPIISYIELGLTLG